MRLKSIKLAGFKSFVDPTLIPFPKNLSAIVGPNGCGKSNVIDAVRWVMGESSAKHLRGESMSDVIFNGSNARKPLGQASIELVFDNSSGRMIGEYSQYSEIAIRRQVTRDGQSTYYFNGTRCRRKDITDLFLGTGLGPRSYAIIEQGTISRLIEAKPEELRHFIEEAAGVSKYKERRRETEQRIRRTRENLDRLQDLQEELDRQLEKLKQQSAAAIKYKTLKEQERSYQAQWQAMRWRDLESAGSEKMALIRDLEVKLEACLTDRVGADRQIETLRQAHIESNDQHNEAQTLFYQQGTEIAKLEQHIQHQTQLKKQLEQDLQQLAHSQLTVKEQLDNDQQALEELRAKMFELEPEADAAVEQAELSSASLIEAEEQMDGWQQEWDNFNSGAQTASEQAQVQQSRIRHLEQSIERVTERLQRLETEQATFDTQALESEVLELKEQSAAVEAEHELERARVEDIKQEIAERREDNKQLSNQLNQLRAELQKMQGREASLQALQQAALGRQSGKTMEWLQAHGLGEAHRLAEQLQLSPAVDQTQWSVAIESALGLFLQAVLVPSSLNELTDALSELDQGELAFIESMASEQTATASSVSSKLGALPTLSEWVVAPVAIQPLLADLFLAESLEQALALRSELQGRQSIITQQGQWVGRNWIQVLHQDDAQLGVIQRRQQLSELESELELTTAKEAELAEQLEAGRERLQGLEEERENAQLAVQDRHRQQRDLVSRLSGKESRLEHLKLRAERIEQELTECRAQQEDEGEQIKVARADLQIAVEQMADDEDRRQQLTEQRDQLRGDLEAAKVQAQTDRTQQQQLQLAVQTERTQLEALEVGLGRLESRYHELLEQQEALNIKREEQGTPLEDLAEELEAMLARRIKYQNRLSEARDRLEQVESDLRRQEKLRDEADGGSNSIRAQLEQERLQHQELQVKQVSLTELLDESEYELPDLLDQLPAEAAPDVWEQELERIKNRVSRLGAINLAAIEEYEQQKERKEYLDTQHNDLTEALETLESAIRKIDKETRDRFKETFEKVNAGLKALFPKVFGGGAAYLELTGEDLLDTGVAIMARPPGKKNSTIHLLSGGEKALTAVALVFAIFQLNPAPFCMLDEVDAPLDDANVGRYSRLLEEMSEQVQFIYVTHNKIAMEIADHLMGVTMHEPGVSRLVAVDVNEAAELAVM